MSIAVNDIIGLAKTLQASAASEAQQRAVVGRAYYATYHDCHTWHASLPSPGSAGVNGGVHTKLIEALSNPTVQGTVATKSKMRGYGLRALKALRAKADYVLADTVNANEASQSIADAERIMQI